MNKNREGGAPETVATGREPVFNLSPVIVLLIGVCALVYFVQAYVLSEQQFLYLLRYGAFIPVLYSGQFPLDVFAFTAPLTYAFMHGSVAHLAVNMIWLAAFGTPLANRLGNRRFLLFWVVTALAAVGLHFVLHPLDSAPLVGASGAISGMMGAAARFGFRTSRLGGKPAFSGPLLPIWDVFRSRTVVTFLLVWMVANIATGVFGMVPGVDQIAWEAHIGGFVAGFFGIDFFAGRSGARSG